jgi:hypothetical protein
MSLDPHIGLSEELPQQKYESYSSYAANRTDTLDEPIIETVVLYLRFRSETSSRCTTR